MFSPHFGFKYSLKSIAITSIESFFAGDTVQVVYPSGSDTTPLNESTEYYFNGFSGFKI